MANQPTRKATGMDFLTSDQLQRYGIDITREMAETLVKEGAGLLDDIFPDWHKRVDATYIDMNDSEGCILGQVYGDYKDAALFLRNLATFCGWSTWTRLDAIVRMNNAWTEAVLVRQEPPRNGDAIE